MKKKITLIISIVLLSIIIVASSTYTILKNRSNKDQESNTVASIIYLDINPSIKIELDKNNKVIKVTPLNEDAKKITNDNYEGKELTETIKLIKTNLEKEGFLKDKVQILLNTTGKLKEDEVKTILTINLETKENNVEVIVPKITESSKELAKKYNITESKAAYIEEAIKENTDLKIEDLKDKSINEITTKKEEKLTTTTKVTTTSNVTVSKNTTKKTTKQQTSIPSSATDTSGVWCTYNKNKPSTSRFDYPQDIGMDKARNYALNYLNKTISDFTNTLVSRIDDKRSSYCLSYKVTLITKDTKYFVYIDSVTGKTISNNTEEIPAPKVSETQAEEIGLKYFSLNRSECKIVEAYYSYNNGKMRYTFNAQCNGKYYSLHIDATTGATSDPTTW